jgi:molybdopterin converting factor small subunit
LAFATAAERLGSRELELELPEGLSVLQFKELLRERFPALTPLLGSLAIAVDGVLVTPESSIPQGREIALLPPVSGG